uniref:hypothetical protein n=1 Tax=Streptomyces chartreusis TaxID=1969 RepID=UPI003F495FC0
MRIRTAIAAAAILTTALAGCSPGSSNDKPSATPAAPSPTAAVDPAAARQACVDAVAAIAGDDSGEEPSEAIPAECQALSDSDYLDAVLDATRQSNQQGRDALQNLIDEASEAAQP